MPVVGLLASLLTRRETNMQAYSDPSKEHNEHSLPDLEIFYADDLVDYDGELFAPGYFHWVCFPACLPNDYPIGPFDTAEEALADARELYNGD